MPPHVQTFSLGRARVSVINIGDIQLPLAEHLNVPTERPGESPELVAVRAQRRLPMQNVLVELPRATVLIDAGHCGAVTPETVYAIPGYAPPPPLLAQLDALGVAAGSVDHVVITHRHWDHFNGTTRPEGDGRVPSFPNARHHLGAADWDKAVQAMAAAPDAIEHGTLGVLHAHGLLNAVAGRLDLGCGVEIVPAPGETVGHQVARVESEGEALFGLGDLYHHPVEFAHPEWRVSWADPATTLRSRRALTEAIGARGALAVATHIAGIGRVAANGAGLTYEALAL